MKISSIIILIIGISLIIVGGAVSFVALSSTGFDFQKMSVDKPLEEVTYEFKTNDVSALDIRDINANVKIISGDYETVKVVALTDSPYSVTVNDNVLSVVKHANISSYHTAKKPRVNVYMPKAHYQNVFASTVSGDISVQGVTVSDALTIETTSGNVNVCAAKSSASDIKATVVSGDVMLEAVSASNIVAEAGSGNVGIKNSSIKGLCQIKTVSGDVVADNINARETSARTGSGDVLLYSLDVLESLKVETVSGDVFVMLSDMLTGTGYKFDVSTASGDVYTPESVGVKPVTISTASGDVEVGTL